MGKYEQDARLLLEYVGGKENIAAVSHCVSRMPSFLRPRIRVLFNLILRQEIHGLSCLFQIVDFRPVFIAFALRRLDTVFNVNQQANAAAICAGSFRSAGAFALYAAKSTSWPIYHNVCVHCNNICGFNGVRKPLSGVEF